MAADNERDKIQRVTHGRLLYICFLFFLPIFVKLLNHYLSTVVQTRDSPSNSWCHSGSKPLLQAIE